MGKKKSTMFGGSKKKDKKKRNKRDKDKKRSIRVRTPDLSITKNERNAMKALAKKPIEVPEENQKIRNSCNHQTKLLTIDEFDQNGYSRSIVPMLDQMIQVFGKNNVMICSACYDVVLNHKSINIDEVKKAICTLYAAANFVVSNGDIKKGEIKAYAHTKNKILEDWQPILDLYRELINDNASENHSSDDDISALNANMSTVSGY